MTKQCSWCQEFDGQAYWRLDGVHLGERAIAHLKKRKALILPEGRRVVVDVYFCSKEHADFWAKSLGGRFFEWT